MKFSHIADVHIGGYREEKLKILSTKAFIYAIDKSIEQQVDFILISGDLFNTSLPSIDNLKIVTSKLKQLKDLDITVYIIAGSHDFSPSGKTMLDVLENAGLCINVVKGSVVDNKLRLNFTIDKKTGAKITGILGKRGMLEKSFYESLDKANLEAEEGFKIFMFHTAISELKRSDMQKMASSPISLLPKGFNYYAGGHVHYPMLTYDDSLGGLLAYTGALFPNNFKELEDLSYGGFFIFDTNEDKPMFHKVHINPTYNISVNCDHLTPEEITSGILKEIENKEFYDTIILIRLSGKIRSGKTSEIDFKKIFDELYEHGAYFVMKNTLKLTTEEFEEIKMQSESITEIEESLINEHIGQFNFETIGWDKNKEFEVVNFLLNALDIEKSEGEKVVEYEERIKNNVKNLINLE